MARALIVSLLFLIGSYPGFTTADEHPTEDKAEEHPTEGHAEEHPTEDKAEEHPTEGHSHKGSGHDHKQKKKMRGSKHKDKKLKQKMKHKNKKMNKKDDQSRRFSDDEIKAAIWSHYKSEAKNGVFTIKDEKTAKNFKFKLVKVHDPVARISESEYFACTDFHPANEAQDKRFDVDFWLKPENGKLVVKKEMTRIHKDAVKKNGKWAKAPRYTFVNNQPVPIKN